MSVFSLTANAKEHARIVHHNCIQVWGFRCRHECPTATKELAMFHWTYLNQDYNEDVLNVWKNQGCYEDVHWRLGYRLTIQKV